MTTTTEIATATAEEITRHHDAAQRLAADCRERMAEAVHEADQCGFHLAAAKEEHRGQFLAWLRDNVPSLTHEQAKAYMGLHDKRRLNQDHPLDHRQLMLIGVVEQQERDPHEREPKPIESESWVKQAGSIRGYFAKKMESRPVDQWALEERETVARALEPIVAIWRELTGG